MTQRFLFLLNALPCSLTGMQKTPYWNMPTGLWLCRRWENTFGQGKRLETFSVTHVQSSVESIDAEVQRMNADRSRLAQELDDHFDVLRRQLVVTQLLKSLHDRDPMQVLLEVPVAALELAPYIRHEPVPIKQARAVLITRIFR